MSAPARGRQPGPARIDQVVHILAAHDAIGAHVLHARDVLRAGGYESDIYAGDAHLEVRAHARPIDDLSGSRSAGRWLLVHHSTGSAVAEAVLRRPEPKILDYHNITPAAYVSRWAPSMREELELGRDQLDELVPASFYGLAHSSFSRRELEDAGLAHTAVVPPLFDLADAGADPDISDTLAKERASGGADWLFVGRVSPHKAQHDLVKALAAYRRLYDPRARLHLVGTSLGADYPRALERFATRLGIADAVRTPGSVTDEALVAYYRSADVFVCASDHEGFCVPLVEAMHLGLPVVAYGATAVGETVGDGGLVLPDKTPVRFAAAVRRVVEDPVVRGALVDLGHRRAEAFTVGVVGRRLLGALDDAVAVASQLGMLS